MPYRTCIFCNRNDSKPGREDVLANWIAREFGEAVWEVTNIETKKAFTKRVFSRDGKIRGNLGLISKRPCTRCNNTWMSKLESAAKPILIPLMNGAASVLTPDQQLIVVRWFIKTVIAHELLNNQPSYFQRDERHALMKSLSVPTYTMFFLAEYRGSQDILTRGRRSPFMARPNKNVEARAATEIEGYTATFAIKHLALQVFSVRIPEELDSTRVVIDRRGGWDDAEIQIWPIEGDVNWPPPLKLDDAGFELFTNRWADS